MQMAPIIVKASWQEELATLASLSICEGVSNNTPFRFVKQKPELNTGGDKPKLIPSYGHTEQAVR